MPPKKQPTLKQGFISYSVAIHHEVNGGTKKQAETSAETTWKGLDPLTKNAFDNARKAKEAAQVSVDECRAALTRSQARMTQAAAQQDVEEALEAFDELSDCHEALHSALKELEAMSRTFTNVANGVHPAPAMQQYAEGQHRSIKNARKRAGKDWTVMLNNNRQLNIPPTRNRELKIPEKWLPEARKGQLKKSRQARFLRNLPGMESQQGWVGGWHVGGGGQSHTGLWVRCSADGTINDRVLRKDVRRVADAWADTTLWDYPINGPRDDINEVMPTEVACHYNLDTVHSERFGQGAKVPHLRNHMIDLNFLRYTMYMDYCGYGDLHDLVRKYVKRATQDPAICIPEPFLWRVFLSLSATGLAMQQGTLDPAQEPLDDKWREIVHRDLKLANIFLDEPTPGQFESYPTPRMGDFGIAVKTSKKDVLNPTIFHHWAGTRGWEPPEQSAYVDFKSGMPVHRFKQLSTSNVYGVGMIMLALMTLNTRFDPKIWPGDGENDMHMLDSPEYSDMTSNYSNHLNELVQECIQFNPNARITFDALLDEIENFITPIRGEEEPPVDPEADLEDQFMLDSDLDDIWTVTWRRKIRGFYPPNWDENHLLCLKDEYASALAVQHLSRRKYRKVV